MAKSLLALLSVVLCISAAAPIQARHGKKTFTIVNVSLPGSQGTVGDVKPAPGVTRYYLDQVYNTVDVKSGKTGILVGTTVGTGIYFAPKSYQVSATTTLSGKFGTGTITYTGISDTGAAVQPLLTITGGTGDFAGAVGTADPFKSVYLADKALFYTKFTLQ